MSVQRWTTASIESCENGGFVAYGDYLALLRQQGEPVAWEWCDTIYSDHCHTTDEEAIAEGWIPLVYGSIESAAPTQGADARPVAILEQVWNILMDQKQPHLAVRMNDALKVLDNAIATRDAMPSDAVDAQRIAQLAREVEVECLSVPGVNFYMAAEMAVERTLEMATAAARQHEWHEGYKEGYDDAQTVAIAATAAREKT